jgi:hypothetical protein
MPCPISSCGTLTVTTPSRPTRRSMRQTPPRPAPAVGSG